MIENKIKTIKQLLPIIKSLKKKNKTIAFTNGCFDILHVGHVKYLEKAKSISDILVVAVNSNKSLRELKGKKRPIVDEKDRMIILAALESVDYVVKFKEGNPLSLIRLIKPDILIKGGDWKKPDIIGANFVKSYGGKVKTIPYIKRYSTSSIIKSIKNS